MKIARLATALLFCLPTFAQDTAMFRGNLAHTGVYNAVGVQKFSKIKWKFHTDGQVISSPAVAGGTVYVGSTDGSRYAVDLASGTQKCEASHRGPRHVISRGGSRSRIFRKL